MGRPAYSACLVNHASVDDEGVVLGSPAEGTLWVVRVMYATFGSYFGYVRAALALESGSTRQWLAASPTDKAFGTSQQTFVWEGRFVVPAGDTVIGLASSGDTCDIKLDGYVLDVGS